MTIGFAVEYSEGVGGSKVKDEDDGGGGVPRCVLFRTLASIL